MVVRRLAATLAALVLLLVAAVRADAAQARVALVIGNGAYTSGALANPPNDATDMAAKLKELGFSVTLLVNATQLQMKAAVRAFGQQLRGANTALVYYAGHGVQIKGENFLIPVNAVIDSEADAEDQGVSVDYVLHTLDEAGTANNIVILDACRNNPFARSFRSMSRGLAVMQAAAGTLIAYSTAPGSVAADGRGRNGTYTKHLLAELSAGDSDVLKVFQRVRTAVVHETGGKQTPWEATSLVGEFTFRTGPSGVLATAPPVAPLVTDPDDEAWAATTDTGSAAGYRAYLEQFPHGRHVATARIRVAELSPDAKPAPTVATATRPAPSVPALAAAPSTTEPLPAMVHIPGGRYTMGGDYQAPAHAVSVPSFLLGRTEVTRGQFRRFVEATRYVTDTEKHTHCSHSEPSAYTTPYPEGLSWLHPGYEQTDAHPVVCVSWNDAKAYIAWLNRTTGRQFRLPTEAEWELAARFRPGNFPQWDGELASICAYENAGDLTLRAAGVIKWPENQSVPCRDGFVYTAPVGSFKPNGYGLYDMLGNAREMVEDCWIFEYQGVPTDGSAFRSSDCDSHVVRGGSFDVWRGWMSPSKRGMSFKELSSANSGFRLAQSE